MKDKIKKYPKTEFFEIIDTIGVPHPFCITHHHVGFASDNHMGMLGREAIMDYERKHGQSCGIKDCNLRYEEHEQALAVKVKTLDKEMTQKYLESIVEKVEADGFAGFVFVKDKSLED